MHPSTDAVISRHVQEARSGFRRERGVDMDLTRPNLGQDEPACGDQIGYGVANGFERGIAHLV